MDTVTPSPGNAADKAGVSPVIYPSLPTTLKAIGCDEYWLQNWIVADPTRLGLGPVIIKAKELRQYGGKGGRLPFPACRPAAIGHLG